MTFKGLTFYLCYATVNTEQESTPVNTNVKESLFFVLAIAGHLAYMVLIPLFVFGGLGLAADRTLGTLPLCLLIGIGLALITTLYWMATRLKRIIIKK